MTTWEPFSEAARRVIARSQTVAQLFGCDVIGTEHLTFAFAERDDAVGAALAHAVDREALRERLGGVHGEPGTSMQFSEGVKRSIELAFANARRLEHPTIRVAHLALGVLGSEDAPPLRADTDLGALRAALDEAARREEDEDGAPAAGAPVPPA